MRLSSSILLSLVHAYSYGVTLGNPAASSVDSVLKDSLEVLPDGSTIASVLLSPDEGRVWSTTDSTPSNEHGEAMINWLINTKGGMIHPHVILRNKNSNSTSSPSYSLFVTGNVSAGELLFQIPRSMVLQPLPPIVGDRVTVEENSIEYAGYVTEIDSTSGFYTVRFDDGDVESDIDPNVVDHQEWPVNCATVNMLAEEMKKPRGESRFAPYVNYLLSVSVDQLPAAWSQAGQTLLKKVLHWDNRKLVLPPYNAFERLDLDWKDRCNGQSDPINSLAYVLVKQRSWDDVLIPVYDLIRHMNGRWHNTDNEPIRIENPDDDAASNLVENIKVYATKDVQAGEELSTSYNFCTDCQFRKANCYGTPEILRDYGFVEDYPRRFEMRSPEGDEVCFDIDYQVDATTAFVRNVFQVQWVNDPPADSVVQYMQLELQRLISLNETEKELQIQEPRMIPLKEQNTIQQYINALIIGLSKAIAKADGYEDDISMCDPFDSSFSYCPVTEIRYPRLAWESMEIWADERPNTCDWDSEFHYGEWNNVASYKTPYQSMQFDVSPFLSKEGDMCFDLDLTVQMCTSYRPQYHEMFVHYPARFLPKIERILFVGGGDSMLLHESLKYPDLDLVVGLELDQQVVRASFEHFGTQPHFDNEKVQWWFGDATKSLLVIPKEYFGSFDLVLVDLSETVMALTVTSELDVLETLSLLVKPGGIMVQNEYEHFLTHTAIFQDVLAIHYDDVPVVCSQSIIVAANRVDFLRGPYFDHGVPFLYGLLGEPNVRHNIIRNYQHNSTNPHHCSKFTNTSRSTNTQSRSQGVVLILEVETISVEITNVKSTIANVLKEQRLEPLTSVETQLDPKSGYKIVFVFAEGYVIARMFPNTNYVAFDLHFWGDLDKQDATRRSLILAMGGSINGSSSSTFRIVAGGMFGVNDWERHSKAIGPHLEDFCNETQPIENLALTTSHVLHSEDAINFALAESFDVFLDDNHNNVIVLCGSQNAKCESISTLQKSPAVANVVPLRLCFDVVPVDEIQRDDGLFDRMRDCERELMAQLYQSQHRFRAMVVDPSASFELAQIVAHMINNQTHKDDILSESLFVYATVRDEDSESWRKAFVDLYRKGIYGDEPVFRGEVQFDPTDRQFSPFSLYLVLSGTVAFSEALSKFADRTELRIGYKSDIRSIRCGNFHFDEVFQAEAIFSYKSYDHTDQRKQWEEQFPVALQTIMQLEVIPSDNEEQRSLTCSQLQSVGKFVLTKSLPSLQTTYLEKLEQTIGLGEGCVLSYLWNSGSAIITFDGRRHIDLNLFLEENGGDDNTKGLQHLSQEIKQQFLYRAGSLQVVLFDQMPRGFGRVMIYPKSTSVPFWN